jgi:hypothetical protein
MIENQRRYRISKMLVQNFFFSILTLVVGQIRAWAPLPSLTATKRLIRAAPVLVPILQSTQAKQNYGSLPRVLHEPWEYGVCFSSQQVLGTSNREERERRRERGVRDSAVAGASGRNKKKSPLVQSIVFPDQARS